MDQDPDVEEFTRARAKLEEFVRLNNQAMNDLRHLIERYNDARDTLVERVKAHSKESRKKENLGPFTTKVSRMTRTNFDALEEIVEEEEFRSVVDINYKFRGDKGDEGRNSLALLREKYGKQLDGLEVPSTPSVEVQGPKSLDIKEIEGLL